MGPSPEGEVIGDAVDHSSSQRRELQHHRLETQSFGTLGSQDFKDLGQLYWGKEGHGWGEAYYPKPLALASQHSTFTQTEGRNYIYIHTQE